MVSNADASGRFTRRDMLLAGISSALACSLAPSRVWSAVTHDSSPDEWATPADLYAFAAPSDSASVLAMTWCSTPGAIESVRLHVNEQSWRFLFSRFGALQNIQSHGLRPSCTFAGPLRSDSEETMSGIVVEVSNEHLPARARIWAEQGFRNGRRQRVGFLSLRPSSPTM